MENRKGESVVVEMGGTEGTRRGTGVAAILGEPNAPDPEVLENKPRRRFSAKYKLRILNEADACTEPGQIGALLRREGLYSSNLTTWRRQRDEGQVKGLSPKRRGRKFKDVNPLSQRVAELERETQQLRDKLKKAELIIEFQKKISEILGIPQDQNEGKNS